MNLGNLLIFVMETFSFGLSFLLFFNFDLKAFILFSVSPSESFGDVAAALTRGGHKLTIVH